MGGAGVVMSDETKEEIAMAECGACRAIVPLNSENCPECDISFSGVSDESLGECGACNGLVPLDSTKCSHCGTIFVADDVVDVLRKWLTETGITIPILFKKFDTDGDGLIDSAELKSGLLSLKLADLPPSQVERLIKTIDEDGDGQIDLGELHETITGESYSSDSDEASTPLKDVEEDATSDDPIEDELETESETAEDEESEHDEEGDDPDDEHSSEDDDEFEDSELEPEVDEESDDAEVEPEVDEESDNAEDYEDSDLEEMEDDFDEEEVDEEDEEETFESISLLHLISDAMDESGDSPSRFFNSLDKDGDGNVTVEEFTNAIEVLIDSEVSSKDIESFLVNVDDDGDGAIDIIEFVTALESLEDADDAVDDDSRLSKKVDKPFPTEMQRKMMGKQWNDIIWPLIHLAFGLFIAAWLINGLGGIGPLAVDGTGGSVALETAYGLPHNEILVGDIYPCDPSVQVGECKNSLTPFSGEASSMPAGFYADGIIMMVLGGLGLLASLATHLAVVPGWRARAKAMKEVEDDTDEARSEESNDEDSEDESDEDTEEEHDEDSEDESDEDTEEEHDEDSEEEQDVDDDGDADDIDIGSHVGISLDDEEVFGVIIEFDDDEETVTIKEDGTGDLVTGYQEDMFVE